jgi:hypothetical protein
VCGSFAACRDLAGAWNPLVSTAIALWSCVVGAFIARSSLQVPGAARHSSTHGGGGGGGEGSFLGLVFVGSVVPVLLRFGPPRLTALLASFGELCWLAALVLQERVLSCGHAAFYSSSASSTGGGGGLGSAPSFGAAADPFFLLSAVCDGGGSGAELGSGSGTT